MRLARVFSPVAGAVTRRGAFVFAGPKGVVGSRRAVSSKVVVEPNELDVVFPRESPVDGFSYDLNWSLCAIGVIPQGKAFRNLKAPKLKELGGTAAVDAPKVVPYEAAIERELKAHLGSEATTAYVQDCALGAIAANEVASRIVTDSPAAALAFRTLCATTQHKPVSEQKCNVVVLHTAKVGPRGAFITINPKTKMILMGGSIHAGALVNMLELAATDSFLRAGVMPLFGPACAKNETVFLSSGFKSGGKVKHGFAYSQAGFCRLLMGSASEDGKVVDEYKLLPNHLPAPKAVVMFANDTSATIPAASKLTADQAGFYYVAACAQCGVSEYINAAQLVMHMAREGVQFYMVNRGAFEDAKDADAAAKAVVGAKGSVSGPLGLEVLSVSGKTKSASADAASAASKALIATVSGRCKGMDSILSGGPKIETSPPK